MAVQTTRTLPAQFVEDLGKDLASQVVAQTGVPVVSTGIAGISQQPGETAAGSGASGGLLELIGGKAGAAII